MTVPLNLCSHDASCLRCFCCDSAGCSSKGPSRDLAGVNDPSGVEEPFTSGDFCRMLDIAPGHSGQVTCCCHLRESAVRAPSDFRPLERALLSTVSNLSCHASASPLKAVREIIAACLILILNVLGLHSRAGCSKSCTTAPLTQ